MFLQQRKTHLSKPKKLTMHRKGCKSFIALLLAEDTAPDTSTRKLPGGQECSLFGALSRSSGKFPEPWCQSKSGSLCLSAVPMHPPVPKQHTQDRGQFVGILVASKHHLQCEGKNGGGRQRAASM